MCSRGVRSPGRYVAVCVVVLFELSIIDGGEADGTAGIDKLPADPLLSRLGEHGDCGKDCGCWATRQKFEVGEWRESSLVCQPTGDVAAGDVIGEFGGGE